MIFNSQGTWIETIPLSCPTFYTLFIFLLVKSRSHYYNVMGSCQKVRSLIFQCNCMVYFLDLYSKQLLEQSIVKTSLLFFIIYCSFLVQLKCDPESRSRQPRAYLWGPLTFLFFFFSFLLFCFNLLSKATFDRRSKKSSIVFRA